MMEVTKSEFYKVAMFSSLLFFISFISLISDLFKGSDLVYTYPFFDVSNYKASLNPIETYSDPIKWYVKYTTNRIVPILCMLLAIFKPDFSKLGFNLLWMWVFYFTLILIDQQLFLEYWPFRGHIDAFVCCVQFAYVVYCFYLYYSSKQVET